MNNVINIRFILFHKTILISNPLKCREYVYFNHVNPALRALTGDHMI